MWYVVMINVFYHSDASCIVFICRSATVQIVQRTWQSAEGGRPCVAWRNMYSSGDERDLPAW